MSKPRLDLPLVLGILAGIALTSYVSIATVVRGTNPLAVPIIIAVGVIGTAIGLYVGSRFSKRVIGKNRRITTEYEDEDDPDGGITSDQGGRGA